MNSIRQFFFFFLTYKSKREVVKKGKEGIVLESRDTHVADHMILLSMCIKLFSTTAPQGLVFR